VVFVVGSLMVDLLTCSQHRLGCAERESEIFARATRVEDSLTLDSRRGAAIFARIILPLNSCYCKEYRGQCYIRADEVEDKLCNNKREILKIG
jgi:hypothetical protein